MFEIKNSGGRITLVGRFDASRAEAAKEVFSTVTTSADVDFSQLTYISSAGLGVLLGTQKRLAQSGHHLRLRNLNHHIREIFHIAGFDQIFEID